MKNLFVRTFVVALGIIAASAVVAWTGPTGTAPNNNAPAPINTTATTQTKAGILSSSNSFVAPNMTANQFCIGTSCVTSWGQAGGSGFTGSGSINYVTKFTGTTALGNSSIYDNGNIGIGATDPQRRLDVNGYVRVRSINGEGGTIQLDGNNGTTMWVENINGTFRLINSPWTAGIFNVDQSGNTSVSGSLTSAGQPVCLANGTNCPAAGAPAWSAITGKPFNWSGQSGQPTWLWGSNDGTNYYVWNPSNFSVNYANSAPWSGISGKPGNLAYWDTWYGSTYHGSDGNIYLGWLGDWLSNRLNQAVTAGSNPSFGGGLLVAGQPVCLANGTNCPAAGAPAWSAITGKPGNLAYWDTWYGSTYHGSDGNIYLGWLGDWLSNRLNQDVRSGANPTFGNTVLSNTSPTIFFADTDNRSAMIHNNSNLLYVLRGCGNGSTSWCAYNGVWPLVINLENNDVTVGGAFTANGNITAPAFLYSSDRRLKNNIAPIQDALAKIVELRGVNFNWASGTRAGQADVGVIAQEVQSVLPEAVHTDAGGYLSVDYPKLVPLLIQAVKEQQMQIEALKAEVDALRAGR